MAGLAQIAKNADVTVDQVQAVLDSIKSIAKREPVRVHGFGTFKTVVRAARKARNPQTGKEMLVAAKSVFTFKVAKPKKTTDKA